MAKVTSKLQITVPKALAQRFGLRPGDEIDWQDGGEAIRVVPAIRQRRSDTETRLRVFDQATARQKLGSERIHTRVPEYRERAWNREELYRRGKPDRY